MTLLELGDPLAHRALEALIHAETSVRRALSTELEREGLTPAGFSGLVLLVVAGGRLELKTLRRRLHWSKANATEVCATLEQRGLLARRRRADDRRVVLLDLTPAGAEAVERVFPGHTERVSSTFAALDAAEKRSLADLCRKLAA